MSYADSAFLRATLICQPEVLGGKGLFVAFSLCCVKLFATKHLKFQASLGDQTAGPGEQGKTAHMKAICEMQS